MIQFVPCIFRSSSRYIYNVVGRGLSTDIDFSHEKPAPEQLEHIQKRLVETVPYLFRQRLDYTFYRRDVFCDDQIFQLQKHGRDALMQHFGTIGTLGQVTFPHIEMEVINVIPMMEDGTVRCRWRVKYVSFPRLFTNLKLFRREYRLKNLSWFDGYSVLTVDGNGHVYKITLQKTQSDDSKLLHEKTATEKLAEKIAVFRPGPTTQATYSYRQCSKEDSDKKE